MLKLRGVLCPIATPFNHRGELYATKIRHNIGRLELTKISGFVIGSTWGEGPLLSDADLVRLWREVKEASSGTGLLLGAAGRESVSQTLALCRDAKEAGLDAVWIRPHRTFTNDAGLQVLHFRSIADGSALPVVIGEVTPSILSPAAVVSLAAHPNVAAVCSSEQPLQHLAGLIGSSDCAPLTSQITGLADALAGGIQAAVLPLANVLPFHLQSIAEAVRTREVPAAQDLEQRLKLIDEALATYGVPGLKHAMDLRGYFGGTPRLPLSPVGSAAKAEIEAALDGLTS